MKLGSNDAVFHMEICIAWAFQLNKLTWQNIIYFYLKRMK